jgi:hypothetical protein
MARSSLLWNAICTVSGGLVVVLAAAAGPSSIARSAGEPVRIHARLSQGANPPLLQLEGTQDGRKSDRFAIQGTLAGLPCPGKTYRLVLAGNLGPPGSSYDATFVLRRSGGDSVRCGVQLPRKLGRTLARVQVYGTNATPADSVIVVSGRRIGTTKIKGLFTTRELPCDRTYKLRMQLSAPSGRVSVMYDLSMKKVSINGRRCI